MNLREDLFQEYEAIYRGDRNNIEPLVDLFKKWALEMVGTNEHSSDCASHNEPAEPNGPCNCSYAIARKEIRQRIEEATK